MAQVAMPRVSTANQSSQKNAQREFHFSYRAKVAGSVKRFTLGLRSKDVDRGAAWSRLSYQ
jgi:hypothetical protein